MIFKKIFLASIFLVIFSSSLFAPQISEYFGSIEITYSINQQEGKIINSINSHLSKNKLAKIKVSAQLCNAASDYLNYLIKQKKIVINQDMVDQSLYKYGSIVTNHHPFSAEYSSIDTFLNKNLRDLLKEATSLTNAQIGISVKKYVKNNSYYIFIIFADDLVQIEPFPSIVTAEKEYYLKGHLLANLRKPEVMITNPKGAVDKAEILTDEDIFQATLKFSQGDGKYQIEIIGTNASGPHVAAIFPVYVGAVTNAAKTSYPLTDKKYKDFQEAEEDMIKLINYDRAEAGLAPIHEDPSLTILARSHSRDMSTHNFFAHVSPNTGSLSDRFKRGKIPASKWSENIALNSSLIDAQRSLMESPGHRSNILDKDVNRVGVGIVFGRDGLYITQNFAKIIQKKSISQAKNEILNFLNQARNKAGLDPLELSEPLSNIAQNHCRHMSTVDDMNSGNPLSQLEGISFSEASSNIFVTSELNEVKTASNLIKPSIHKVGIGVLQQDSSRYGNSIFWVTLLFTD
ncbi:MAG: CAP domain-containing protein [bacterium]